MSKKVIFMALAVVTFCATASHADVKGDCKKWLRDTSKRNPSDEFLEKRCTCVAGRATDSSKMQRANDWCKDNGK
ncbi:MAG: hypothetical protein K2W94_01785 [Alphaproteobacteria bacterium]|nr:hypothetical protein [Alphaproteobacteria bacterium]